jgi:hypothetical protein
LMTHGHAQIKSKISSNNKIVGTNHSTAFLNGLKFKARKKGGYSLAF